MEGSQVSFKKLHKDAIKPKRHSTGAAGYDLHSIESGVIEPFSSCLVRTGFTLNFPENLKGILLGRSGLGKNHGISIFPTIIKTGEEIIIKVVNIIDKKFEFEKGFRIGQLIFAISDNSKLIE